METRLGETLQARGFYGVIYRFRKSFLLSRSFEHQGKGRASGGSSWLLKPVFEQLTETTVRVRRCEEPVGPKPLTRFLVALISLNINSVNLKRW